MLKVLTPPETRGAVLNRVIKEETKAAPSAYVCVCVYFVCFVCECVPDSVFVNLIVPTHRK